MLNNQRSAMDVSSVKAAPPPQPVKAPAPERGNVRDADDRGTAPVASAPAPGTGLVVDKRG